MTIQTVCQAIADVGREVSSIRGFYARSPGKLDSAQLPALIALAGPATVETPSYYGEFYWEARQYRVQVIVAAEGQRNIQLIEEQAEELLYDVRDVYMGAPSLGDVGVEARVLSDTGIIQLVSFESQYIGFELLLQVREPVTRTYLEDE